MTPRLRLRTTVPSSRVLCSHINAAKLAADAVPMPPKQSCRALPAAPPDLVPQLQQPPPPFLISQLLIWTPASQNDTDKGPREQTRCVAPPRLSCNSKVAAHSMVVRVFDPAPGPHPKPHQVPSRPKAAHPRIWKLTVVSLSGNRVSRNSPLQRCINVRLNRVPALSQIITATLFASMGPLGRNQ